jgi:chitinase
VHLSNSDQIEADFIAPNVVVSGETLFFQLIVTDNEGLQATDSCSVDVTREAVTDSDEDGVPDDQDDFPYDPDEHLDTDGDGEGNNADDDDDNDGMPDTWELLYGLDPLKDDAAADPDGDEISNINEYNLGSEPNYNENNFAPDPPQLLNPGNDETVGLTPLLETDEFYDPNINDVHSRTQWKIKRVLDEFCVFDVTTSSSLTALKVPKLILEEDTDYSWQVKFIDNQGTASEWSEAGYFTTEFLEQDSDGNGVLDHQEVDTTIDLDKDGMMDRDQEDIKCVATETGDFKICLSIQDAEKADSIVSIQSETPDNTDLLLSAIEGPKFLAFGLIHFSLLVKEPGDEVVVTIYLSKAAYDDGIWYKYDPVNAEWIDYSDFIDFSADRKMAHLTLTDGGFGDADGIENGVIVDPLALRTASDHSSGSDSFVEDIAGNLDPTGMCFISSADSRPSDGQAPSFWSGIRSRELSIVFILMIFAYIGIEISLRIMRNRKIGRRTSLMEGWRNS